MAKSGAACRNSHGRRVFTVFTVLCLCSSHAIAQMYFQPRLELELDYVENIDLVKSGGRSDWIAQLNPGFDLAIDSPGAAVFVEYQLQTLNHQDLSEFDDEYHQVNGSAELRWIENALTQNIFVNRTQQVVSFDRPGGYNQLTNSNNLTDSTVYGTQMYWTSLPSGKLQTELSVGAFRVDEEVDSNSLLYSFEISPYRSEGRFSWSITSNYRVVDYETGLDATHSQSEFEVDFALTDLLSIVASVGYDKDVSRSVFRSSSERGDSNSVGFNWQPKGQAEISVRYEQHYYGDYFSGEFSIPLNRLELNIETGQEVVSGSDLSRDNIFDPTGILQSLVGIDTAQVFTNDFFKGSARYVYPRGFLNLALVVEDRSTELELFGVEQEETFETVTFEWFHKLNRRLSVSTRIDYDERELRDGVRYDELFSTVELSYEPRPGLTFRVFSGFGNGSSDADVFDYLSRVFGAGLIIEL